MNNIYKREDLLEIYKNPANQGKLNNSTVMVTEKNPMCGDVINLYLQIENGKVTKATFDGDMCSVSIISSELLIDEIVEKELGDIENLDKKDLLELINLELTTSRIKCATLPLDALKKGIREYDQSS